jgi:hypothetical protein
MTCEATLANRQSKLLGALTVTALKHLGESTLVVGDDNALCPDWRMARVGDVALLEKPADNRSPKRIDCYQVTERRADGAAFRLDLARLVYSLRWLHQGEPPDFELVLIQEEPQHWINTVNMTLLIELRRRAPHAINWSPLQVDVVPMLNAFEGCAGRRGAAIALRGLPKSRHTPPGSETGSPAH